MASKHNRISVLGAGKMGGILLQAFLQSKLFAACRSGRDGRACRARRMPSAKKLGIPVSTDNLAAAAQADVILLGREATADGRSWWRRSRRHSSRANC